MNYFVKEFDKDNVRITGYVHDLSEELQNVNKRPAILIFPGGGYSMCSDREAEPVALAYMAEGYQAFVLRYSVGQEIPFSESYDDAVKALNYLKEHGEELHIDIEKIAVAGFSAGGHLAASVATMCDVKPSAMILGYPCILASMGKLLKKELPGVNEEVTNKTPPAFIFSTSDDLAVPVTNSLEFADALDQHGVEFELHIYRKGQHGLSLAKTFTSSGKRNMVNPAVAKWFTSSITWLKGIWGDFEVEDDSEDFEMEKSVLGINTPVTILLNHEHCKKILLQKLPDLKSMLETNPMAGSYSLSVMNRYSPENVTDAMLKELEVELSKIEE